MNLPASTIDDVIGEMGWEGACVRACSRTPCASLCARAPPTRAVTKLRGTGVTTVAMNKTEPVAVTTNVQLCEWQGGGGGGGGVCLGVQRVLNPHHSPITSTALPAQMSSGRCRSTPPPALWAAPSCPTTR